VTYLVINYHKEIKCCFLFYRLFLPVPYGQTLNLGEDHMLHMALMGEVEEEHDLDVDQINKHVMFVYLYMYIAV